MAGRGVAKTSFPGGRRWVTLLLLSTYRRNVMAIAYLRGGRCDLSWGGGEGVGGVSPQRLSLGYTTGGAGRGGAGRKG